MRGKALAAALAAALSLCVSASGATAQERALWVWKAATVESPQERDALLTFAARKRIGTLFLSAPARRLEEQSEPYRNLLRSAHERGMSVHALVGEAEWLLPGGRDKALSLLQALGRYQQQSRPAERFDALHLDVEPQSLPEWKAGRRETLAASYIAFVEWIREQARPLGLPLVLDIPVSFNRLQAGSRPLAEAVLDRVDEVAVMAYKDTAQKVLEASWAEVEYGASAGKKVWIGISADPEHLRAGASEPGLESVAATVVEVCRTSRGCRGLAIHDYARYRRLAP